MSQTNDDIVQGKEYLRKVSFFDNSLSCKVIKVLFDATDGLKRKTIERKIGIGHRRSLYAIRLLLKSGVVRLQRGNKYTLDRVKYNQLLKHIKNF